MSTRFLIIAGDFTWFDDVQIANPIKLNVLLAGERVLDFCVQPDFQSALAQRRTNRRQVGGEATIANFLVRSQDEIELHSLTEAFSSQLEYEIHSFFDSQTQSDLPSEHDTFADYGPFQNAGADVAEDLWRLTQVRDFVSIGAGNKLCFLQNSKLLFSQELDNRVTRLIPSLRYTRPRVLVTTQHSVALQSVSHDNWRFQPIVDDVVAPHAMFMRNGRIIVAHEAGIEVFSNRNFDAKLHLQTSDFNGCESLCLHEDANFFYTLNGNGKLTLWNAAF